MRYGFNMGFALLGSVFNYYIGRSLAHSVYEGKYI